MDGAEGFSLALPLSIYTSISLARVFSPTDKKCICTVHSHTETHSHTQWCARSHCSRIDLHLLITDALPSEAANALQMVRPGFPAHRARRLRLEAMKKKHTHTHVRAGALRVRPRWLILCTKGTNNNGPTKTRNDRFALHVGRRRGVKGGGLGKGHRSRKCRSEWKMKLRSKNNNSKKNIQTDGN